MSAVNSVLVDVQTIFLAGLKAYFREVNPLNINVVGEENTAEGLLLFLHKNLQTNLIIMDLNLPDEDGLELIPKIRKQFRDVKILVLTSYGDYKFVGQALKSGADGYILKSNETEDLLKGLEEVLSGNTYLAPGLHITPPNGKRLLGNKKSNYEDRFVIKQKLTTREHEVLELITQAKNNKEIAKELFISDQTVGVHRKNIMRKLGVRNTINLIKFALENQLV
ncbi:MAG: response regulator transcription factor [Saprospiraceae bacterium]|nr:response regulator transcription factor [Bacteroidia bacterium]NNE15136.1 response regulator transcription factor [Saprospiraceae bacterium]NNL92009.1 response regulator transcription factor [Saprospiraceae bacterium]